VNTYPFNHRFLNASDHSSSQSPLFQYERSLSSLNSRTQVTDSPELKETNRHDPSIPNSDALITHLNRQIEMRRSAKELVDSRENQNAELDLPIAGHNAVTQAIVLSPGNRP
jgi:hypothetical protein